MRHLTTPQFFSLTFRNSLLFEFALNSISTWNHADSCVTSNVLLSFAWMVANIVRSLWRSSPGHWQLEQLYASGYSWVVVAHQLGQSPAVVCHWLASQSMPCSIAHYSHNNLLSSCLTVFCFVMTYTLQGADDILRVTKNVGVLLGDGDHETVGSQKALELPKAWEKMTQFRMTCD
jgi:hypothetical protein